MLFSKYIPFMVRERFVNDPISLRVAEIERFPGSRSLSACRVLTCMCAAAVAFVDISGFTKLSEKLVKDHGVNGAEMLNKYISGYFTKLIEVIVDFGGE
jgi:class 3 adenylate cyclase